MNDENLNFEEIFQHYRQLMSDLISEAAKNHDDYEFPEPPKQVRYKEFEKYLTENGVNSISRANLAFYINKGVLPPSIKEANKKNQAFYDKRHIFGYMFIELAKQIFSLDMIKELFIGENDGDTIQLQYTYLYNSIMVHRKAFEKYGVQILEDELGGSFIVFVVLDLVATLVAIFGDVEETPSQEL